MKCAMRIQVACAQFLPVHKIVEPKTKRSLGRSQEELCENLAEVCAETGCKREISSDLRCLGVLRIEPRPIGTYKRWIIGAVLVAALLTSVFGPMAVDWWILQ
jgi:hypothetical protein